MANIRDFDSVFPVELLLERKDHNHFADVLLDLLDSSGEPGPYLRADKIEDRNVQLMKLAGKTKIKFREINQDGGVRLALCSFRHELVKAAIDSRQMSHNFSEANDRDFFGVD